MREGMPLQREDGFTLADLIPVLVVLALIIYAAFSMLDANIKAGSVYKMQTDLSQEVKKATDTMADQIRTAHTFTIATDSDLTFTSYVTGTSTLYNVRFWLSNQLLYYSVASGGTFYIDPRVIAEGVTSLDFDYIGSSGTELCNPSASLSAIYGVEINMAISRTSSGITEDANTSTVVRVKR